MPKILTFMKGAQYCMISSSSNTQIKNLAKLQKSARARKEQNVFVTEGRKMFEEARELGIVIRAYVSESYLDELTIPEKDYFETTEYETVSDKVFREVADTMTPQGILAIVKKPSYSLDDFIKNTTSHLLLLEDLRDPGNLGTLLRTAEGAGMTGVIMSKETVDLFNPKVVRSTMGSIFRIPFLYVEDFQNILRTLQNKGFSIIATDLQSKQNFTEELYPDKSAVIIGNESKGISDITRKQADILVHIPMCGKLESLNASVAGGLMMYELHRQRKR